MGSGFGVWSNVGLGLQCRLLGVLHRFGLVYVGFSVLHRFKDSLGAPNEYPYHPLMVPFLTPWFGRFKVLVFEIVGSGCAVQGLGVWGLGFKLLIGLRFYDGMHFGLEHIVSIVFRMLLEYLASLF